MSFTKRRKSPREQTDLYANALVLLHIGALIPSGVVPKEIIVEGDNDQLKDLIAKMGFRPRNPIEKNDHVSLRLGDTPTPQVSTIVANIERLRSWPIARPKG